MFARGAARGNNKKGGNQGTPQRGMRSVSNFTTPKTSQPAPTPPKPTPYYNMMDPRSQEGNPLPKSDYIMIEPRSQTCGDDGNKESHVASNLKDEPKNDDDQEKSESR